MLFLPFYFIPPTAIDFHFEIPVAEGLVPVGSAPGWRGPTPTRGQATAGEMKMYGRWRYITADLLSYQRRGWGFRRRYHYRRAIFIKAATCSWWEPVAGNTAAPFLNEMAVVVDKKFLCATTEKMTKACYCKLNMMFFTNPYPPPAVATITWGVPGITRTADKILIGYANICGSTTL